MRPNLLQFFQAILPDTGVFSAITRNKIDYKFKHKIFYSVRDLAKFCATQLDARMIYISPLPHSKKVGTPS